MSAFGIFAACITTIAAYHLDSLVRVSSKHLTSALNIPVQNAGTYTSKLNILRFLFKFFGCLIECVLCRIALIMFEKSYDDVLDKLESAIRQRDREIQEALREHVNQMISEEERNANSSVDELLKPIQVYSNKIILKSFVELIKPNSDELNEQTSLERIKQTSLEHSKPSSVEKRKLKKDEKDAVEIVLQAVKNRKKEIKDLLNRHNISDKTKILENGKKCAEQILAIGEISDAAKQGDNVLYKYVTIFEDIIFLKQNEIGEIMKPGSGTSLQSGEPNIGNKNNIEDKLLNIIQSEMPKEIVRQSYGMKRKYKTIELGGKISSYIVEDVVEIKEAIENKCESILGANFGGMIKKIGERFETDGQEIKRVISGQIKDKELEIIIRRIMETAGELSKSILRITSIKEAVDKYAPSYTLIATVLEYMIRWKAENISNALVGDEDLSEITKEFKNEIEKDPKDLVKAVVKNIIANIIIKNATEIAKEDGDVEKQIKQTIEREITVMKFKKEIITVAVAKSRQSDLILKANSMAHSIINQEGVSFAIKRTVTTFGREINELSYRIKKSTKDAIKKIITDSSSGIAKREENDKIIREIVSCIKTGIKGKLSANKNVVISMKAKRAAVECRKILSIITLSAMLATRAVMLWIVNESKKVCYLSYIVMIIESLFLGMFQTSLLTLTGKQSPVIRLSIELSSGLVMIVQTVLTKLFYVKDQGALIIELWIICMFNFLAIIVWICYSYADSNGTKNENFKERGNDYKATLCSPYLMFFFSALIKEFLYPNVVSKALITSGKSVLRTILLPLFIIGGIVTAVVIELKGGGNQTYWEVSDWFWVFLGPQVVVCVMALLAIHTKGCMSMYILENKPFVIFLSFALLFCHSMMATISYLGVADYVEKTKERFKGYIESHSILADIFTFLISRLSVGYDKVRRDYGLGLNVIIADAMEQPKPNVFVRECLSSAWTNVTKDFKTNISECL